MDRLHAELIVDQLADEHQRLLGRRLGVARGVSDLAAVLLGDSVAVVAIGDQDVVGADGIGDGWLGRYFDNQCAGSPDLCAGEQGVALGRTAPPAMEGRTYKPIAFETPDLFKWTGLDLHPSMAEPYRDILETEIDPAIESQNPNAAFLMRTALDAQVASEKIRRAVESEPLVA